MKREARQQISNEEQEFLSGKISSLFLKYGVPSAIGILFIGIQTVIDGIFAGNFAGPDALAAVNIAIPVYTFMASLIVVVGIGCQTVIGISSGAGNHKKGSDALRSAFLFLLGLSTLMTILVLCFRHDIVIFLGADDQLYSHSVAYLTALAPFFPLLSVLFLGDYFLKSQGKPYLGMTILGTSVVINIILDYLFIAHLQMGALGAGLATGISFNIGALFAFPHLFKRKSQVAVQKGKYSWKLIQNMLYNGSSEGVSELSAAFTMFMFNRAMMLYIGAAGVAAFTSINYLIYMGITLFVGMSDGLIPVMSYNYGAANMKRVLKILRTNIVVNGTIGLLLCILAFFGGKTLVTLFFNQSAENMSTINLAVNGSKICAFAFLFNGFNIAMSSFFTSMGDARTSVVISLLRGLIFISIGLFIFPRLFDADGVWFAIPFAELCTLIIALIILRYKLSPKRIIRNLVRSRVGI